MQYLRHYPDTQIGSDKKVRQVWVFEFRIHSEPPIVPVALDAVVSEELLRASATISPDRDDDEVITAHAGQAALDAEEVEGMRSRLLSIEARQFEFFVKDLLLHWGFTDVCVTKATGDGGVDVNGRAGPRNWLFTGTLVQVQAKRWLHSVGRKEVAELRGSLQPYARGAVVTTGHFSKAALNEARDEGKHPIALIDGFQLARIVLDEGFRLPAA